jgi:hypothetical protein
MTRLEIQQLVSQWVDDTDQGYFTPTILNVFINNALYEIQKRLVLAGENYYVRCVTTPVVQDQNMYALPTDFWGIRRLRIITSGSGATADRATVGPITMNQEEMLPKTGLPKGFYLSRDSAKNPVLFLAPAPTTTTWTIEMDYVYIISMMSNDSDLPDAPEHFHEYIALLAAYNCFIKDDKVPTILQKKIDYYEDMLDDAADNRVMAGVRNVVITPEGFWGSAR